MSPIENIRIGFVKLNLVSDDVSGDERVQICENYEVAEQDFKRLHNFYFDYVEMGDPQYRKVRIQRMLRLLHRIFAMNINMTNEQSREEKKIIITTAQSLFEQFFSTVNINGKSNPYFNYFYSIPEAPLSDYADVNNDLVLIVLAFLGPHFLYKEQLFTSFIMLAGIYTGQSFDQAFDSALLCENINEYNSPQSLANQLNAAGLDAGTALLIGLTAMASAAFQRMNSELESQETLENLLIRCSPFELLPIIYSNIACHCRPGRSCPVPGVMYTLYSMQEFTNSILGFDPTSTLSLASSAESLNFLVDYIVLSDNEGSDSEGSVDDSDSGDQDLSIVVQQQNELIAELRQELANQTEKEEACAVGGASAETKKCPLCTDRLTNVIALQSCGHAGFCKNCVERLIREERECPFCRSVPLSYMKILDMSLR
ncbi:RING finger protein [Endozoicomonas sp. ALD040]|uniref:RING finger protein n=1 Tax=unclassified Endozoicomonas TaxID=2644528 RepID=UPI003BAF1A4F